MTAQHTKTWKPENGLLDRLSVGTCARIGPLLHRIELPLGKILYDSGGRQSHMYFPRSGIVSMLYVTESGDTSEIAMVGNEGMAGTAVLVHCHSTPSQAVVRLAGEAYAIRGEDADREFKRGDDFQFVVLRYTQFLLAQMAQTAVCNRHHTVEKQLSRWLLQCLDRTASNELRFTQEDIAGKLGVRREAITEAAGGLQEAGVIRYSRGRITVLDRPGLQQHSCECYAVVKAEYARLLGSSPQGMPP